MDIARGTPEVIGDGAFTYGGPIAEATWRPPLTSRPRQLQRQRRPKSPMPGFYTRGPCSDPAGSAYPALAFFVWQRKEQGDISLSVRGRYVTGRISQPISMGPSTPPGPLHRISGCFHVFASVSTDTTHASPSNERGDVRERGIVGHDQMSQLFSDESSDTFGHNTRPCPPIRLKAADYLGFLDAEEGLEPPTRGL